MKNPPFEITNTIIDMVAEIAEVKNAYEIYERLNELDPYSVDDLLTAHRYGNSALDADQEILGDP